MSLVTHTEKVLLPITISCSLLIILFIWIRARAIDQSKLIHAHWQAVWKRSRIVLIAYSVSVALEVIAILMTFAQKDPQLREIMIIAFTRVAIVPTLLVVTPILISSTLTVRRIRRGSFYTKPA